MCGRTSLFLDREDPADRFGASVVADEYEPRYIIAPGEPLEVVTNDEAGPDARRALCRLYPDDNLAAYEVSPRVDDPGNDDPRVVEPAGSQQSGLGDFASG